MTIRERETQTLVRRFWRDEMLASANGLLRKFRELDPELAGDWCNNMDALRDGAESYWLVTDRLALYLSIAGERVIMLCDHQVWCCMSVQAVKAPGFITAADIARRARHQFVGLECGYMAEWARKNASGESFGIGDDGDSCLTATLRHGWCVLERYHDGVVLAEDESTRTLYLVADANGPTAAEVGSDEASR